MEVQTVSQPKVLLDQRALEAEVGVLNTADLGLRTSEGDVVQLSFANEFNFSGSKSETREGDAVTQEISTVAQAAARYSLSVEGDLNEDELAAIQELASKVEPIATEFFQNGEFNIDEAVGSLSTSLGVLEEISLELERTITATFAVQETRVTENPSASEVSKEAPELQAANVDAAQLLQGAEEGRSFVNFPKVQDITELVLSVVETEFPARGVEVLGSENIVRSLRDLMQFLRDRITTDLEDVQSPEANGEVEPAPSPEPTDAADFIEV